MKKRAIAAALAAVMVLAAVLAACAPAEPSGPVSASVQGGDFELTITAEKGVVSKGERIVCYADLTYIGQGSLTALHSDPMLVFSILDDTYFSGDYAVQDSLNRTTFKTGEVKRFDFQKSGGYSADDPDADFLRAFYAEKALVLPPGEYTLSAIIEYATDENDMRGTMQDLTAQIMVTVRD